MSTWPVATKLTELSDQCSECPICLDVCQNVCVLRCSHNFCTNCLLKLISRSRQQMTFNCPTCRQACTMQETGLASTVCDICGTESNVPATHCIECKQTYCNNCLKVHSRCSLTQSHELITLQHQLQSCEEHSPINTPNTSIIITSSTSSSLSEIERRIQLNQQQQQQVDVDKQIFLENIKRVEREISSSVDKLKQLIDAEHRQLLEEIRVKKDATLKEFVEWQDSLQQERMYLESLLSAGTQSQQITVGRNISPSVITGTLCFTPSQQLTTGDKCSNFIGTIHTTQYNSCTSQQTTKANHRSSQRSTRSTRHCYYQNELGKIDGTESVCAMCVTDNCQLFVCRQLCSDVQVYDASKKRTYKLLQVLNITTLTHPTDIVQCCEFVCLCSWDDQCLYRLTRDLKQTEQRCYPVGEKPLSVCCIQQQQQQQQQVGVLYGGNVARIRVYEVTEMSEIHCIELNCQPTCFIHNDNKFVVCSCDGNIYIVDAINASILGQYQLEYNKKSFIASDIVCTTDSTLIVVDSVNSRVLSACCDGDTVGGSSRNMLSACCDGDDVVVVDSKLLCSNNVSECVVDKPTCVCVDSECHRLFVASDSGTLHVFDDTCVIM